MSLLMHYVASRFRQFLTWRIARSIADTEEGVDLLEQPTQELALRAAKYMQLSTDTLLTPGWRSRQSILAVASLSRARKAYPGSNGIGEDARGNNQRERNIHDQAQCKPGAKLQVVDNV
jgi:hypothetical protein